MADELITSPPRFPANAELDTIEKLAVALYELPPYRAARNWANASIHQKMHYRGRAAFLLDDFEVTPRFALKQEIRTPDDFAEHMEQDILLWGSVLVRIPKPQPDPREFFASQDEAF